MCLAPLICEVYCEYAYALARSNSLPIKKKVLRAWRATRVLVKINTHSISTIGSMCGGALPLTQHYKDKDGVLNSREIYF